MASLVVRKAIILDSLSAAGLQLASASCLMPASVLHAGSGLAVHDIKMNAQAAMQLLLLIFRAVRLLNLLGLSGLSYAYTVPSFAEDAAADQRALAGCCPKAQDERVSGLEATALPAPARLLEFPALAAHVGLGMRVRDARRAKVLHGLTRVLGPAHEHAVGAHGRHQRQLVECVDLPTSLCAWSPISSCSTACQDLTGNGQQHACLKFQEDLQCYRSHMLKPAA